MTEYRHIRRKVQTLRYSENEAVDCHNHDFPIFMHRAYACSGNQAVLPKEYAGDAEFSRMENTGVSTKRGTIMKCA